VCNLNFEDKFKSLCVCACVEEIIDIYESNK